MIELMRDCGCTNVRSHLTLNGVGTTDMTEKEAVDCLISYTNTLEKHRDILFTENKELKQANSDYENANDSLAKTIIELNQFKNDLVHERDALKVSVDVLAEKVKMYESVIPIGTISNGSVMRSTGFDILSRIGRDRRSPSNIDTRPIHEECDSMGVKFACRADRRLSVRRKDDRE